MQVTKDSSIEEILKEYPHSDVIFRRHGLHCVDCIKMGVDCIVGSDTLETRAEWYGISIDSLVEELNVGILTWED